MQKIFKIYNRGNARVWIEGDILKANGFHHGRRFKRIMIDYTAICDGQKAQCAGYVPTVCRRERYRQKERQDCRNGSVPLSI